MHRDNVDNPFEMGYAYEDDSLAGQLDFETFRIISDK